MLNMQNENEKKKHDLQFNDKEIDPNQHHWYFNSFCGGKSVYYIKTTKLTNFI